MDRGVELVLLVGGLLVGATVVWLFMRQRLPAATVERIAQAVAEIRAVLGETFTEDDVRRLAGWVWDAWVAKEGYYTREQFIELVVRTLTKAEDNAPETLFFAVRAGVMPNPKGDTPEARSDLFWEAIGGKPS